MPTTSYTARLGVPASDMETLAERYRKRELKLIDLLVAVLLERGGPVAPEEAGARLTELGITHWSGNLAMALKRSMAPSPEVTTDEEGRFALAILDPEHPRFGRRLQALWPPEPVPEPVQSPSPQESDRRWREQEASAPRLEERPAWAETEAQAYVRISLSLEERDLLLEHCLLLDPDVEQRLKLAPVVGSGAIEIGLDLDELEELGGSVAFAANHADDEQLQHRLDLVHDRIATAERWAVN